MDEQLGGGSVPGLCGARRLQRLPRHAVRLGKVKEVSVEEATWPDSAGRWEHGLWDMKRMKGSWWLGI